MSSRTFFLFVSPLLLALVYVGVSRLRLGIPELYWDDAVRSEVQEIVADRYLEPLDAQMEQELFDASMRAYVGTLDPFSRYFTPEERRELDEDTTGSFAGVGVQVRQTETGMLVTAVYNGDADIGLSFDDARRTIRGEQTDVGEKVIVFNITDEIPNDVVAVRSALPDSLKEAIYTAVEDFLATEEGEAIFDEIYGWTDIRPAVESDFDIVREAATSLGITEPVG